VKRSEILRSAGVLIGLLIVFAYLPDNDMGDVRSIEDYQQARSVFWNSVYQGDGETLYCRLPFEGREPGLNIEHVFPMSWVTRALNCGTRQQCRNTSTMFNRIEADLHNLFPALSEVNSARSSFPYSEIGGERSAFQDCDFEIDKNRREVEPSLQSRGDVARAMLYMSSQYADVGLELFAAQRARMLEWNRADPPDSFEIYRNQRIAEIQGNSNPYIDDSL
jgi:deoxyribonuclease I